jgi:hypothetical protein
MRKALGGLDGHASFDAAVSVRNELAEFGRPDVVIHRDDAISSSLLAGEGKIAVPGTNVEHALATQVSEVNPRKLPLKLLDCLRSRCNDSAT